MAPVHPPCLDGLARWFDPMARDAVLPGNFVLNVGSDEGVVSYPFAGGPVLLGGEFVGVGFFGLRF